MIGKFIGIFWHRWRANVARKRAARKRITYEYHVGELYVYASDIDENVSTGAKMALVQVEAEPEDWDGTL